MFLYFAKFVITWAQKDLSTKYSCYKLLHNSVTLPCFSFVLWFQRRIILFLFNLVYTEAHFPPSFPHTLQRKTVLCYIYSARHVRRWHILVTCLSMPEAHNPPWRLLFGFYHKHQGSQSTGEWNTVMLSSQTTEFPGVNKPNLSSIKKEDQE